MKYTIIDKKKYAPYFIRLPVKTLECSRDIQRWLRHSQDCKTHQDTEGWFIKVLIPLENISKVMEAMPNFGWD